MRIIWVDLVAQIVIASDLVCWNRSNVIFFLPFFFKWNLMFGEVISVLFLYFKVLCFGSVETFWTHFFLSWHFVLMDQPWWPYYGHGIIFIFTWFTLSSPIFLLGFFSYYALIFLDVFRMGLPEITRVAFITPVNFNT